MEGDFPSGAMVLVEYNRVKNSLINARTKTKSKPLNDMIGVMMNQLNLYLKEALECNPLLLSTVMHPQYRLAFFQKFYPECKEHVFNLITQEFSSALDSAKQQLANSPSNTPPAPVEDDDDFNEFTASANTNPTQTAQEAELDSYLMGQREFNKTKTELDWWNVSLEFHNS